MEQKRTFSGIGSEQGSMSGSTNERERERDEGPFLSVPTEKAQFNASIGQA